MNNQIQVLKQTELCGRQFNVYGTPETPLFKARDIADMLSIVNVSDLVERIDAEERYRLNLGRQGEAWFLTEDGLYEVLMQSRKPIAKYFKKGVKAILKEIRKTGGYLSTSQEDTPELIMAKALQVAQSTIERHQKQLLLANQTIKEQAPKVIYHDDVLQSPNTYTTTQIAKELDFSSADKFHKDLKARKVMFKQSGQWMLMAKYTGRGFTKSRTTTYTRSDGSTATNTITVWTESGRKFLHELYRLYPEDTKVKADVNQDTVK